MLPANTLTAPQATDDHLEKNIMIAAVDDRGRRGGRERGGMEEGRKRRKKMEGEIKSGERKEKEKRKRMEEEGKAKG